MKYLKKATMKNIYRAKVDKHTKKHKIASEMKWKSIPYPILQYLQKKKKIHIARTLWVHGQIQVMETSPSNNQQSQRRSDNDICKLRTHFKYYS